MTFSKTCVLALFFLASCGPSAEEREDEAWMAQQAQESLAAIETAHREQEAQIAVVDAQIVTLRERLRAIRAAWPPERPHARTACGSETGSVFVLSFETLERLGTIPLNLTGIYRIGSVDFVEVELFHSPEGHVGLTAASLRPRLEAMLQASAVAVVKTSELTPPTAGAEGEFNGGVFVGSVELFDAATATWLCSSSLRATNANLIQRQGSVDESDLLDDLYVQTEQEAQRVLAQVAPGLVVLP